MNLFENSKKHQNSQMPELFSSEVEYLSEDIQIIAFIPENISIKTIDKLIFKMDFKS